jgi:hypothetical protein
LICDDPAVRRLAVEDPTVFVCDLAEPILICIWWTVGSLRTRNASRPSGWHPSILSAGRGSAR